MPKTSTRNRLPQLNVDIEHEQKEALDRLLPYGSKQAVLRTLISILIDLLESEDGNLYLGLLMRGELNLNQILRLDADKRRSSVVPYSGL